MPILLKAESRSTSNEKLNAVWHARVRREVAKATSDAVCGWRFIGVGGTSSKTVFPGKTP